MTFNYTQLWPYIYTRPLLININGRLHSTTNLHIFRLTDAVYQPGPHSPQSSIQSLCIHLCLALWWTRCSRWWGRWSAGVWSTGSVTTLRAVTFYWKIDKPKRANNVSCNAQDVTLDITKPLLCKWVLQINWIVINIFGTQVLWVQRAWQFLRAEILDAGHKQLSCLHMPRGKVKFWKWNVQFY